MPNSVTLAADSESEVQHRPTPESLKRSLFLGDRAFEDRDYFMKIKEKWFLLDPLLFRYCKDAKNLSVTT